LSIFFIFISVFAGNGVLLEDDKPVLHELPIRAATLTALVRLVVNAFDYNGDLKPGVATLPKVVFQMHRWFTSSSSLVEQMMSLHRNAGEISPCLIKGCIHNNATTSPEICQLLEYQTRVCHAIREFQSALTPTSAELVDLSQVPSYDWMRHVSIRNSSLLEQQASLNKQHSRKVSLVFNHLEPMQLAEHITYLEHKVIRRITFHDLKKYADSGSLRDTPRLERSVMMFNGLTQWIQCMVLSRTMPQQRADVIGKFIDVAMKLLELQNFNSLMAVVGSVSHSVLARLSKTMACLSPESKKLLSDLTELLSSGNNFSNYRRKLAESKGFKIPILGIHLKDLISLHVALPDSLDDEMINIRKMAQLSLIFQELEELQNSAPPIDANMDLVNTLRLWGLIRQGYKCRDCGINAHKHCKDLVVMECRARSNPPSGKSGNFLSPELHVQ
ncbi:hypothetical protein C0J52_20649, partial [Blattella germanica]